jgi:hypothetical protein
MRSSLRSKRRIQVSKSKVKARTIDMQQLRKRCTMPIEAFSKEFTEYATPDKHRYWFRETPGAKILFVGHLDVVDVVAKMQHFEVANIPGVPLLFNAWLDDRLGVYIGADLLPSLGVKCDVLLTENEEKCASTAKDFNTEKEYNWMFMFDRSGEDVVMYEYHNEANAALLRAVGYTVSRGSYSCIRELEHLGCSGFNFGTGYYDNHGKMGYANLAHTSASVNKFVKFYNKHANTALPYEPAPAVVYTSAWYGKGWENDHLGTRTATCESCGDKAWTGDIADFGMCYRCHNRKRLNTTTTNGAPNCVTCGLPMQFTAAGLSSSWRCYVCESKAKQDDEWVQCKVCATWVPASGLDKAERCRTCQQDADVEENPCKLCSTYVLQAELDANEGYCKKCYTEGWQW